ncbi:hypothetical protein GCM10009776_25600 [Microbacterium deminutum]|uniref:Uncharacterized protein n=1 Tax=Microbacterium deminutum TaxID=344164 RepID=A0ABN2R146_9MICO
MPESATSTGEAGIAASIAIIAAARPHTTAGRSGADAPASRLNSAREARWVSADAWTGVVEVRLARRVGADSARGASKDKRKGSRSCRFGGNGTVVGL